MSQFLVGRVFAFNGDLGGVRTLNLLGHFLKKTVVERLWQGISHEEKANTVPTTYIYSHKNINQKSEDQNQLDNNVDERVTCTHSHFRYDLLLIFAVQGKKECSWINDRIYPNQISLNNEYMTRILIPGTYFFMICSRIWMGLSWARRGMIGFGGWMRKVLCR